MPISTAPLNGNPILVCHKKHKWVHEAYYAQRICENNDGDHDEFCHAWGWMRDNESGLEPTHWMPLPKVDL